MTAEQARHLGEAFVAARRAAHPRPLRRPARLGCGLELWWPGSKGNEFGHPRFEVYTITSVPVGAVVALESDLRTRKEWDSRELIYAMEDGHCQRYLGGVPRAARRKIYELGQVELHTGIDPDEMFADGRLYYGRSICGTRTSLVDCRGKVR